MIYRYHILSHLKLPNNPQSLTSMRLFLVVVVNVVHSYFVLYKQTFIIIGVHGDIQNSINNNMYEIQFS